MFFSKRKKILFFVVLIVLVVFPITSFADSKSGDFTYTVSGSEITVTRYTGNGGEVTIPSEIGGKAVRHIDEWAFYNCATVTKITIPSSVISIGEYAFCGCAALENITLPASLTDIDGSAFVDCEKLNAINVDPANTSFSCDDGVLYNATKTTLIRCLPRAGVFNVPTSVTEIGCCAFAQCGMITQINLPEGLKTIDDNAFSDCNNLENIQLPSTVTYIGGYTFSDCEKIEAIAIPSGVKNIHEGAFENCFALKNVTIKEGVEDIGPGVFEYCTSLESIGIPISVTQIDDGAFYGCSNLTAIDVNSDNTMYSSESGVLYNKSKTTLLTCPAGTEGAFLVKESVVNISSAFETCNKITSISIPSGVNNINDMCFDGCDNLTEIDVNAGNTVYSSESGVLYNKSKTTLLTCPAGKDGVFSVREGVEQIPYSAFDSCKKLTSISIPSGVTSIDTMFGDCDNLTEINVNAGNTVYSSESGLLYDKAKKILLVCPEGRTEIAISKSVQTIGDQAFMYCKNISSITIPASVTRICDSAFCYCPKLSEVYFEGNAPSSFGDAVFEETASNFRIYYKDGTTGWTTPKWKGYPTVIEHSIAAATNNASYGCVSGGGIYINGSVVTLTAVPNAGYRFVRWTENGTQVSASASYRFSATKNATLIAEFTALTPVGISCSKTEATLYGSSDGSISVSASGGDSGNYEYSINGGASWKSSGYFGGLAAGTYTAAVRDAGYISNIATTSITINQPAYIGSVPVKKIPANANADTALTIVPPSAPKGYTVVSVTYSSTNQNVASVDSSGNITFKAGGKATIITKVVSQMTDTKGKVKTKTTIVKKTIKVKQMVKSISLNLENTTIVNKAKVKLSAVITPGTASNKKVKWTSSNKKIATVSSSGVIIGKGVGTAIITCTAADGSRVTASCTVTVTAK